MKRNFTLFTLLFFFLSAFLQITAQKVRVIDNKGTLRTLNRVTVASIPHLDPVVGDIWFDTNPPGSNPVPLGYNKIYEIKIYDSTGNWRRLVDNIYNNNSYFTSPRKVNGKGNSLTFENINQYNLSARKINFNSYVKSITLNPIGYNNTTHPYYDPTSYGVIANGPFWGKKAYRDSDGDAGTSGQILSSVEIGTPPNTERGTNWVNATSLIKGDPGSVFFANTDGTVTENNNHFFWNNDPGELSLHIGSNAKNWNNKLNVAGTTRTQGVSNSNGTERTPSYRFTSDSDTGMFRSGTNQIGFSTNEIKRLNISNSEIEITNNLSVKGSYKDSSGDEGTDGQILSSTTISGVKGTNWINNPALNNWLINGNTGTNNTNFLGTIDAVPLTLRTNNTEKLKLHETKGQVLVNQAPTFGNHPLVLRANGPDILAFQDASGTPKWHWNIYGGRGLNFVESGVADYRLLLEEGGNVGIGLADPTEKLDVDGKLRVRDVSEVTNLSVGDKIVIIDANGVVKKIAGSFHTVGDIKHGVQSGDHNGWYLLDGRALSSLPANAEAAALSLSLPNLATNLPDATDKVLKHLKTGELIFDDGGSATTVLTQPNLPNVNFLGNTTTTGEHQHQINFRSSSIAIWNNDRGITGNDLRTGSTRQATTTNSGGHSHDVEVSSGGNNTPFPNYQPYLVVNTFIYLGL